MKGNYPNSEAAAAEIQRSIELAKNCTHVNTKIVKVDAAITSGGTLIDDDVIEVCTNYYCGAIVRSGL